MTEVKSTILYCQEKINHKSEKYFFDFYPHPKLVKMCGDNPKIFKVKITEDPANQNNEKTYWGWWDLEDEYPSFKFIYPAKMLLAMCFPYGYKIEEEIGRGKAYAVSIEVLEEI